MSTVDIDEAVEVPVARVGQLVRWHSNRDQMYYPAIVTRVNARGDCMLAVLRPKGAMIYVVQAAFHRDHPESDGDSRHRNGYWLPDDNAAYTMLSDFVRLQSQVDQLSQAVADLQSGCIQEDCSPADGGATDGKKKSGRPPKIQG